MLKLLPCDLGALFTAVLTVSALAVIVPSKEEVLNQQLVDVKPASLLLCEQVLSPAASDFEVSLFKSFVQ